MQTRGRVRVGYLIQVTTIIVIFLILIVLILQDDGTDSILNRNRHWLGLLGFVWLFGGGFLLVARSFYFITLDNQEIIFTTLVGRTFRYRFSEVSRTKSTSETLKSRFYSSHGYQILTLEFADGREVDLSANVYSNFEQLKATIYQNIGGQHNSA
jgi:hypothetical protein